MRAQELWIDRIVESILDSLLSLFSCWFQISDDNPPPPLFFSLLVVRYNPDFFDTCVMLHLSKVNFMPQAASAHL